MRSSTIMLALTGLCNLVISAPAAHYAPPVGALDPESENFDPYPWYQDCLLRKDDDELYCSEKLENLMSNRVSLDEQLRSTYTHTAADIMMIRLLGLRYKGLSEGNREAKSQTARSDPFAGFLFPFIKSEPIQAYLEGAGGIWGWIKNIYGVWDMYKSHQRDRAKRMPAGWVGGYDYKPEKIIVVETEVLQMSSESLQEMRVLDRRRRAFEDVKLLPLLDKSYASVGARDGESGTLGLRKSFETVKNNLASYAAYSSSRKPNGQQATRAEIEKAALRLAASRKELAKKVDRIQNYADLEADLVEWESDLSGLSKSLDELKSLNNQFAKKANGKKANGTVDTARLVKAII